MIQFFSYHQLKRVALIISFGFCILTHPVQSHGQSCNLTTTISILQEPACGSSDGSILISTNNGSEPLQFSIDNGVTFGSDSNFVGLAAGIFTVIVLDNSGCGDTSYFNLDNTGSLDVSLDAANSNTQIACNGDNTGALKVNITGGTTPYSIQWSGSSNSTSESLSNLSGGVYHITVTDNSSPACQASETFAIIEPEVLSLTITQSPQPCIGGSTINLSVTGGTSPYSYAWSNGTSSQNISLAAPGNYKVDVTDANNCTATESVSVAETGTAACIIPTTVITPNDDGYNDTWTIHGASQYESVKVRVYNRWGEQVFSSKGYDEPWDGTYLGVKLPTASYYYIIELDQPETILTGYLTIKR